MSDDTPTLDSLQAQIVAAGERHTALEMRLLDQQDALAELYRALQGDALEAALGALPLDRRLQLQQAANRAFDLLFEADALIPN